MAVTHPATGLHHFPYLPLHFPQLMTVGTKLPIRWRKSESTKSGRLRGSSTQAQALASALQLSSGIREMTGLEGKEPRSYGRCGLSCVERLIEFFFAR